MRIYPTFLSTNARHHATYHQPDYAAYHQTHLAYTAKLIFRHIVKLILLHITQHIFAASPIHLSAPSPSPNSAHLPRCLQQLLQPPFSVSPFLPPITPTSSAYVLPTSFASLLPHRQFRQPLQPMFHLQASLFSLPTVNYANRFSLRFTCKLHFSPLTLPITSTASAYVPPASFTSLPSHRQLRQPL